MGLSEKEAEARLAEEGANVLEEAKRIGPAAMFAGQFKDIMVLILLAATAVSVLLGEISDAVATIVIVLANAILGFVQEYRTERTLESLRSMTAPTAKCYRGGELKTIEAARLVRGDVVEIEAGDRIPADCAVLKAAGFFADESPLTGESEAVGKSAGSPDDEDNSINKKNIVYCGTSAAKGSCTAKVIATGKRAQMGRISEMLAEVSSEPTPLQKRLAELGKAVAAICLAVCAAIFAAGALRGEELFDMLMTALTIAVAAIPEGLPAVVTIALALAVNRMLKRKALVNKLQSVETLGCATVICSDKTGTITENKMTVTELSVTGADYRFSGSGYKAAGSVSREGGEEDSSASSDKALRTALICGALCSDASITAPPGKKSRNRRALPEGEWKVFGDPTEIALLVAAAKTGIFKPALEEKYRRLEEFPFDSENRFMAAHFSSPEGKIAFYKGAEEAIAPRCSFYLSEDGEALPATAAVKKRIAEKTAEMSGKALRVLALAYKEGDVFDPRGGNLVFVGLVGMIDPPREEARAAIRKCASASVKTVMITGDHKETAAAVARKAGILRGGKVMTGAELDRLSDAELDRTIDGCSVFARVEPAHKLRIVRSFKRRGEVVAMTGDGVNDAPAIKEADVGVAMGASGTDVAKQAADVILLDDNLATLVNAVEEGRCVYANIRKTVRYLFSCNIGEVLTMFLGMIMGTPTMLLPVQILLVNLATDGLPAIALGMEPPEKDIMSLPPRRPSEGFFSGGLAWKIGLRGALIGICSAASFTLALRTGGSLEAARTCALITLVASQLVHVFECRSERRSLFGINIFGNMKLFIAAAISAATLAAAVAAPRLQPIFETTVPSRGQLLAAIGLSVAAPVLAGIFSRSRKGN